MSRTEFAEQNPPSPEVAGRLGVVVAAVRLFENTAFGQHPELFATVPVTGVSPNVDASTLAAMAAQASSRTLQNLQQPEVGDVRAA